MSNLIPRGQISTILLSCLLDGDKYGAELLADLQKKSDNQISIKQPTLYGTLSRMEKQGYISSYWKDSKIGGKRHYYKLTDSGKTFLENKENSVLANFSVDSENTAQKYYEISDFEKNNDELLIENNSQHKKFDSQEFLQTLNKEKKPEIDDGIFLENDDIYIIPDLKKVQQPEEKYDEIGDFENENKPDGGVFITETLPKEKIPKVKKLGGVNFDVDTTSKVAQKIHQTRRKPTDADKIEALYSEMNKSANFIKLNDVSEDDFSSTKQLQERYDEMQIKFSANMENNTEIVDSFGKIPTKHLFAKYLTIFSIILLSSLIIYLVFSNKLGAVQYPIVYLIAPILFIFPALYYLLTKNKFRKIYSSNNSLLLSITIFLVGVVAVFSINLLFTNGFSFQTCLDYATTFLYPCVLLLSFVIGGIFDHIYTKKFCD